MSIARITGTVALAIAAAPGPLALYVLLTLAAGGMPVVTAWLMKQVLEGITGHSSAGELVWIAGFLAGTGIGITVVPVLTRYVRAQLERGIGLLAQERVFTAVDRLTGLGPFENPAFLDRLRLGQQAGRTTIAQSLDGMLSLGQSLITVVGFLGSLFLRNHLLAVLVLAAGVPSLWAELALSGRRAGMTWRLGPTERRELFYCDLLTSVQAAKEVRLFGIGAFLRARMLAERRTANAARRSLDRWEVRVQGGLGLLAAMVASGGLLWAVEAARTGTLSIGDVTLFIAAVVGVQGALATFAATIGTTHQALLMFDHFAAVAGVEPDLPAGGRPVPPLRHGIELRDVWFRYAENQPWVLRGVNLFIPHGKAVALVGLNGAGKSTLIKLLCRFHDPVRGSVRWDGIDLRELDPAGLRARMGAVFQDYMRYDLTATENIGLGDTEALDDRPRIEAAATRAGIHRALSALPHGYDTLLSRIFFMEADKDDPETGMTLSGGQWQRLALARALLRDRRDLVILDEPSAGLDAEAEHEVHTALRRHRADRTSLLISHRLGAVREADLIVVLSDGRIVEQGVHDALVTAGNEYARLFTLQASGYQALAG
ncbi:ABC transporter ATP-binding protein [Amycolatopsis pigmentata]|uniref:ABC transporter ATP-binding protein n=1 Tax=Amycolatopsis pigmentata TaxID=450801 RepID=A0ABW5FQI7_9PSEU